jgi:hypothetical protein
VMLPNNPRGETPRYGWLVSKAIRPGAIGIVTGLLVIVKIFTIVLVPPSLAGWRII